MRSRWQRNKVQSHSLLDLTCSTLYALLLQESLWLRQIPRRPPDTPQPYKSIVAAVLSAPSSPRLGVPPINGCLISPLRRHLSPRFAHDLIIFVFVCAVLHDLGNRR